MAYYYDEMQILPQEPRVRGHVHEIRMPKMPKGNYLQVQGVQKEKQPVQMRQPRLRRSVMVISIITANNMAIDFCRSERGWDRLQ